MLECIPGTMHFVLLVTEFEFSELDGFCKVCDTDTFGPEVVSKINPIRLN